MYVTNHNRIYFRLSKSTNTFLELFETKQSPERNKYD